MFKTINIALLLVIGLNVDSVISVPISEDEFLLPRLNNPLLRSRTDALSEWEPHIMEFLELIDTEKLLAVAFKYLDDPEVLNFVTFIFGPQFKELIWEFESMEEFKEAFAYLSLQGYDVENLIEYINSALDLPPFEKPKLAPLISGKALSGLIDEIITVLPMEEFKELFEAKLETTPEIAKLFETINSEEFMDILKKMANNPKFSDFKEIFESYGFDFYHICTLAKEIFGIYFQGRGHATLMAVGPNRSNKSGVNVIAKYH